MREHEIASLTGDVFYKSSSSLLLPGRVADGQVKFVPRSLGIVVVVSP
jgi:hypothetical protein